MHMWTLQSSWIFLQDSNNIVEVIITAIKWTDQHLRVFIKHHYHIYPTPPLEEDMTQGQFFKQSLTGLNSETSCLTKAEEPSLTYYLPIAGGE